MADDELRPAVDHVEDPKRGSDWAEKTFVVLDENFAEGLRKLQRQQIAVDFDEVPWESVQSDDTVEAFSFQQVFKREQQVGDNNNVEFFQALLKFLARTFVVDVSDLIADVLKRHKVRWNHVNENLRLVGRRRWKLEDPIETFRSKKKKFYYITE